MKGVGSSDLHAFCGRQGEDSFILPRQISLYLRGLNSQWKNWLLNVLHRNEFHKNSIWTSEGLCWFLRTVVESAIPDPGPRLAMGADDHRHASVPSPRRPLRLHSAKGAVKTTRLLQPPPPVSVPEGLSGMALGEHDLWFSSQGLRLNSQDYCTICQ